MHASIDQFTPVEIADFTVLTGVNGSGKSHLLEAINLRRVSVQGLEGAHIVLFNYENFRLDNEPEFTGHQLSAEREAAWQFHEGHIKSNAASWKSQLGTNYVEITKKAKSEKKSLWSFGGEVVKPYINQFKSFIKSDQYKGNHQAQGIYSLAKKLPYSIDEIGRDEFIDRYKPYVFKNDFLPTQLGRIFWDYYVKYQSNQVNQFQNDKYGKSYTTLGEEEFISQHGEKPWVLANRILKSFDALTYEFVSPEGHDFFGSYKLELQHTQKPDLKVEFDKLSSGERILMALVASIYKASSDGNFPDLLLLDEIDASLHPSMMKNMLNVIDSIFLPEGVKVILVTHSPTTIALAPEDSIFVMNPSGMNRIEKRTQKDALSILTQGYATIEEGLKFFDEVARSNLTIITEGYNTTFIRKALDLNGVDGVEVLCGIEGTSGKNQLRTLFEFFSRMDHKNTVLFVFDCDVSYALREAGNTVPFIFKKNDANLIASSGVENLFDPTLMAGFTTKISHPNGSEMEKFHQDSKRQFEEFILGRNCIDDFVNFESLIETVKRIKDRTRT
ncbi:MAG: AAA family ATPase [Novosphingobium sp.]